MKNKAKLIVVISYTIGIISGIIISSGLIQVVSLFNATEVEYDTTNSDTTSIDVQSAIDELYDLSEAHCPNGYVCERLPDLEDPKSFGSDSWTTIAKAVENENTIKYKVGDTKEVNVEGYGTFTIRIANKSTPEECTMEGFSQTACCFVIEFVDVITVYPMNLINTNKGGWQESKLRIFINNDIYSALPKELKSVISDTFVVFGYGASDSGNFITTDKLYLLSTKEVWGKWK